MGRINYALGIYMFSAIFGAISEYFGSMQLSYAILLVLVTLDTITGIWVAVKYKRFSSKGLYNFVKKVIYYTICIITVRLAELVIVSVIKTTMLSQVIVAYLAITECVSVLENLTILGAPIPEALIKFLINSINIPGTKTQLKIVFNNNKEIIEIEDMINYQISTYTDGDLKELLEINFRVWQGIINQINLINEGDSVSKDLLYYKLMSIFEVNFKDREHQFKDSKVHKEYIDKFYKEQQCKVDRCFKKIKNTCYADKTFNDKKEEVIESIMILLYETLMDGHRSLKGN